MSTSLARQTPLDYMGPSSATKCFNGVYFAFFHTCRIATFHNGDRFACMNLVWSDRVPCEIAHTFNRISCAINSHLILQKVEIIECL